MSKELSTTGPPKEALIKETRILGDTSKTLGEITKKESDTPIIRSEYAIGIALKNIREEKKKEITKILDGSPYTKNLPEEVKNEVIDAEWRKKARKNPEFKELRDELVNRNRELIEEVIEEPTDIEAYNTAIAFLYEQAEEHAPKHENFASYIKIRLRAEVDDFAIKQGALDIPEHMKKARKEAQEIADLITQRKKTQSLPEGRLINREIVTKMNEGREEGQKVSEEDVRFLLTSPVFEDPLYITSQGDVYDQADRVEGEVLDRIVFVKKEELVGSQDIVTEVEDRAMVAEMVLPLDKKRREVLVSRHILDETWKDVTVACGDLKLARAKELDSKACYTIKLLFPINKTRWDSQNNHKRKEKKLGQVGEASKEKERSEGMLGNLIKSLRESQKKTAALDIEKNPETKNLPPEDKEALIEEKWRKEARKNSFFTEARDELVQSHLSLMEELIGGISTEGAYNAGIASLYEAAEVYDPNAGRFAKQIKAKIWHEMDTLAKNEDALGIFSEGIKRTREAIQDEVDVFLQERLTKEPPEAEPTIAEITERVNERKILHHNITDKEIDFLLTTDAFEEPLCVTSRGDIYERVDRVEGEVTDEIGFIKKEEIADPTQNAAEEAENRAFVAQVTKGLKENEKKILAGYYFWDQKMDAIGDDMDISRKRVSQIHGKAIANRRARFRKESNT